MPRLTRRSVVAAAGSLALPRFAVAQADRRPTVTVAVQKVSNSNTLEVLREQSNVGERIFFTSLWEGLIGRDWLGDQGPVPLLATAWRRIDDRTVELDLREGVRFHNGDVMTVEDVVFSFGRERMMGDTRPLLAGETLRNAEAVPPAEGGRTLPREVPAIARRIWPALDRVEAVGRNRVRFVNAVPDVTLEGRISRYGSEICSRRAFEAAGSWLAWARAPVTTGPYRVASFRPDSELVLEAHDEYWGGRPPLRRIRFVEVPEVAARVAGLLSGEYQFACDIPPDQIGEIERNARFEVQGAPILNHRIICFDKNHAQLADPRIRRALTHAIDRQAIVESLWAGRTVVPKGLQWPFYGQMFIADWSVPAHDPALAARLVREAGYRGDPIPYRCLNNYYTNQVATAQILLEMWKAVGLNVELQMVENWQQILAPGPTRAIRDWSNSALYSDPVSSLTSQHGPNGGQQQWGEWRNEEFNRLAQELETSTDRPRRRAVFARMLEIAEREDPAYTVLHQNATFTAKPRAIRWRQPAAFAMDFRAQAWGGIES
ncbi:ABC transporter substrate-binding protein [Elioraea sp.]|jgi:peptide/nickel transport system substrate-binding protein|uniref:ABC transporter substrate-binding protein n=1 Tax=Elioraea sp. TaxID=2185103 RepID=UPI0021DB9193|nr:ABC transporter substrate-binding protein [Elioraea sp.]GIX11832.1 MAG: ABC transporter substrate-binding protein [Elioraea sp.]